MADPRSKANVDPNFEKQLRQLKKAAKESHDKGRDGGQVKNFKPVGWNGDPFDYDGLGQPFSREKVNDDFVASISDPENPGTTGDVVACSVMLGQLSTMERAFRVRHTMRRCRATAHVLGRQRGQGDDNGPFIQLGVEYVRSILKQAKRPGT